MRKEYPRLLLRKVNRSRAVWPRFAHLPWEIHLIEKRDQLPSLGTWKDATLTREEAFRLIENWYADDVRKAREAAQRARLEQKHELTGPAFMRKWEQTIKEMVPRSKDWC